MSWSYFSPDGNFPSRAEIEAQEEREQEREQERIDLKRLYEAQETNWKVKVSSTSGGFMAMEGDEDYDLVGEDWKYCGGIRGEVAETIQEAIDNLLSAIVERVDHLDFNTGDVNYSWN